MSDPGKSARDGRNGAQHGAASAPARVAPSLQESAAAAQANPTSILGEVVALMMATSAYRHVFVGDLEWMVLPAIMFGQCKVYRDGNQKPVAFAAWAHLSSEVEARLDQAMPRIAPQEWRSGDRLWLITLLAPPVVTDQIVADLQQTMLAGKRFKYHRLVGTQRSVVEVTPMPAASPAAGAAKA